MSNIPSDDLRRAMPADAELLAHIKKAVPGLIRVNTALMVAKAILEKFGSRHAASEVKWTNESKE